MRFVIKALIKEKAKPNIRRYNIKHVIYQAATSLFIIER